LHVFQKCKKVVLDALLSDSQRTVMDLFFLRTYAGEKT